MHFNIFFVFGLIMWCCTLVASVQKNYISATVYFKNNTYSIRPGILDKEGLAYGVFNDTILKSGWNTLNIRAGFSNQKYQDENLMYAAGYLEGFLTSQQIYQHLTNVKASTFGKGTPPQLQEKLQKFFTDQDDWMRGKLEENQESPFWKVLSLAVSHFDGLQAGYAANPYRGKPLEKFDFQLLNSIGDVLDLQYALIPESIPDWNSMSQSEMEEYLVSHGHCSSLVKLLPGYEDVFFAHSSWFQYQYSYRIYKHYHFRLSNPHISATNFSFSSYPGILESLDDFYILGSGLLISETTNLVFNKTLYSFVKPESLLAWQRVRVANFMAADGKTWGNLLDTHNSGTFNNQYTVLDTKRINLKEMVMDGALWVIEQIPTLIVSGDQTDILTAGYWPSYNVPFYEEVYNLSDYDKHSAKFGDELSYQLASRAKIFRRDQSKVTDMNSMLDLMRYNDYRHDPYSQGNPLHSICCRNDLTTENPQPFGCLDTKATNITMATRMQAYAINGAPTWGGRYPAFSWTGRFSNVSHVGLPLKYDFDFVFMSPLEI